MSRQVHGGYRRGLCGVAELVVILGLEGDASGRMKMGLQPEDLIDAIEELAETSPQGLLLVMISACNELRGAVDEGRADIQLLVELREHVAMLIQPGPAGMKQ